MNTTCKNLRKIVCSFVRAAAPMFLPLAVALILGVFSTWVFYIGLNHWTLHNLRQAIADKWVKDEGIDPAARDFILENIRARRVTPRAVPTTGSHPHERVVIQAAAELAARQSAQSLADSISKWFDDEPTVSGSDPYPTFTVLRVRHWPDPTDDVERAIVTIGYFPGPKAPAVLPAPAAWLVPLGNNRASVRRLKPDEMPTFGQLAQANLACAEESGRLFYAKDAHKFDPGSWSSDSELPKNSTDVQRIERQWVSWHVQRFHDWILNAQDSAIRERLRSGLRDSPLSLYASADDITLIEVDGKQTARLVASRTGSFGSSTTDGTPDFYVEFHTSKAGLRWSSEYFAKEVVEACKKAVPDAIADRHTEAVLILFFAGLKLDESAKSAQGVAFLTVPSVPSFEHFRKSFADTLRKKGFDAQVSTPASRGAHAAATAEQEAAEQRSNLRLVEVYRPTVSMGSLVLFRWFNGPIQWITVWVFWTTMFLLLWRAFVAVREIGKWQSWLIMLTPTIRSVAYTWANENKWALQKKREQKREELLDEAAEDIDRFDAKFRWLAWFFPNLGLLGTLFGLGAALGGSDRILAAEKQVDMIMATQYVNGSMSVAFDTTIVGVLAMAAFLSARFFVQWLERWSQGVVANDLANDLGDRGFDSPEVASSSEANQPTAERNSEPDDNATSAAGVSS